MAPQSSLPTPASRQSSSGTSLVEPHWYDSAKANTAGTVQAVAAVIAVFFAYRTVRVGLRAIRDQRLIKELERRQAYFSRYMLDVAMESVPVFHERAAAIVQQAATAITALSPHSEQHEMGDIIAGAIDSFNEQIHQLREHLSFADMALGDTRLWPIIESKLSALEDDVVQGIEQFAIAKKRNTRLDVTIAEYSALILREIYQYDIGEHALEGKEEVSRWRRMWSVGIQNLARRIQRLA